MNGSFRRKKHILLMSLVGLPLALASLSGPTSDVYARAAVAAYDTKAPETWLDGVDSGTGSLGMRLNVTEPIIGFSYEMRTIGRDKCSARLSLYRWNKDFKTTVAAEPVATKFFDTVKNGGNCQITFPDDPQSAGEYLFLIHETSGQTGCKCMNWEQYDPTYGLCYENGMENKLNLKLQVMFAGAKPEKPFKRCVPQAYTTRYTPPEEYVVPEDSLVYTHEVLPDTWVFTDALGRESLTYKDVGPIREDKTVAMFYWTWNISGGSPAANAQKSIEEHPEALYNYNHPVWNPGARYFWNEPVYGYYLSNDQWVIRRQGELLANAGVDAIFTDNTNSIRTYREQYLAVYEAWTKAMNDGVKTPKVSYMLPFNGTTNAYIQMRSLFNNIYAKNVYQPLWFYWDGKPMLMAQVWGIDRTGDVESNMLEYFTIRKDLPYYICGPDKMEYGAWGWLSMYPQAIYYKNAEDEKNKKPEQITVGVAQNHNYVTNKMTAMNGENCAGRAYTSDLAHIDDPDGALWGYNFEEQFEYALKVDPRVIFITGWNEWNVGRVEEWCGVKNAFPDEFNDAFSRDLEPVSGLYGDNYYCQLVDLIRRYKGASLPEPVKGCVKMNIEDGNPAEWDKVTPEYFDAPYDTVRRDWDGNGGNTHYVNDSGRNDIVSMKVCADGNYIYFYCRCREDITEPKGDNWMNLFLNSDCKDDNGWNGFDYLINRHQSGGNASIEVFVDNEWMFEQIGEAMLRVTGNVLELKVPRALVRLKKQFEFKWADNSVDDGDIMKFYDRGDTAPDGRFCYRCILEDRQ